MIRVLRILTPIITIRSLLSIAQSTNFPGNNREHYFAHSIHGNNGLDVISVPKDILIVPREWDEPSRQTQSFPFSPVKK
jgi:hypothetical protein